MKHQLATLPPDTSGEHDARSLSDSEVSALTVTPRRHYGRWAIGILLLAVTAALLRSLLNNENIDKAVIVDYLFSSEILQGLENTLIITVLAMSIAMVLGTVVAAMRTSSNPWLDGWLGHSHLLSAAHRFWFSCSSGSTSL